MRLAASLPIALLLATADMSTATSSPSVTTAPTVSQDIPSTFITTASNCTHTGPTHSMHRRDTEAITSAPAVAQSARPPVFTSVTCIEESNYGEEDGYVKHICKTFEYRLKELESGAGCALPLHSTLWGMAAVAAITMLF